MQQTPEELKQLITAYLVYPDKIIQQHANGIFKRLEKLHPTPVKPLPKMGDIDFLR